VWKVALSTITINLVIVSYNWRSLKILGKMRSGVFMIQDVAKIDDIFENVR
jgi:hypothetical protein